MMLLLYLDPGSGSFLIQLLIASLAGAGIAIAISWGRIKRCSEKTSRSMLIMTRMTSNLARSGSFYC